MKRARIVVGANYGDEGKGTVVAHYTKNATGSVLNILTNGGAQRGHSILTEDGSITFQHFGSGTYHGADSYYSRFFILNPMQFVQEYESLIVKPVKIYRDWHCRWSTPYDIMANLITEHARGRHASCGMGIWNTVKRTREQGWYSFDQFLSSETAPIYLEKVKLYYEKLISVPEDWKPIWNSPILKAHFLNDCRFLAEHTEVVGFTGGDSLATLDYDNLIFENGQGLLLCDEGKDVPDRTPSNTGLLYSLELLKGIPDVDVTAHYVTRPYLTRHGDGHILNQSSRSKLSNCVEEDRTNHLNDYQGEFRYGVLDLHDLQQRILKDSRGIKTELEVTHCDEVDRVAEFTKTFTTVHTYDSALIR